MTRKHFQAIAAALKNTKPTDEDGDAYRQWRWDCRSIADACFDSNMRFEYNTFYAACGYNA